MKKAQIIQLRSQHRLHNEVENKIKAYFDLVEPNSFTLKEAIGTTSGRTDTTTSLFTGKGKLVHVEVIASKSMVLRDLNNLLQSHADYQMAVIMDEKIDPEVPKEYFGAAGISKFTLFWITDFLDPTKKDKTLVRLQQVIREVEKLADFNEAEVVSKYRELLFKLNHNSIPLNYSVALFPRKDLNMFEGSDNEIDLQIKYYDYGLGNAANPQGAVVGTTPRFGIDGNFLISHTNMGGTTYNSYLAIGKNGDIIFSFLLGLNEINTLYADSIEKDIIPTLKFASNIFKLKEYSGVVDVVATLKGAEGKWWILRGQSENPHANILKRFNFYSNDIITSVTSTLAEEIGTNEFKEKFFTDFFNLIKRNTNEVPIR